MQANWNNGPKRDMSLQSDIKAQAMKSWLILLYAACSAEMQQKPIV